jgi:hypothetical protein
MPDHNLTGKRLHLERMAAVGLGNYDAARNLVSKVIALAVSEREDAYKSLALLFGLVGIVVGFFIGWFV